MVLMLERNALDLWRLNFRVLLPSSQCLVSRSSRRLNTATWRLLGQKLNPSFIDGYNNLGNLLLEQEKYNDAIICFKKALELNPNSCQVLTNIGNIYQSQRKFEYAIKRYKQFDERRNTSTNNAGTGRKIGEGRVYWYGVSDAAYEGATTDWDLYLFDIQTYTDIYVSSDINDNNVIPFLRELCLVLLQFSLLEVPLVVVFQFLLWLFVCLLLSQHDYHLLQQFLLLELI